MENFNRPASGENLDKNRNMNKVKHSLQLHILNSLNIQELEKQFSVVWAISKNPKLKNHLFWFNIKEYFRLTNYFGKSYLWNSNNPMDGTCEGAYEERIMSEWT